MCVCVCRGQADSIKSSGEFYGPARPSVKFTSITTREVGAAAAAILANPGTHAGKTYTLAGPAYSHEDLAAAYSAALSKPVSYVQVSYEDAKASFISKGWPEWQVWTPLPALPVAVHPCVP